MKDEREAPRQAPFEDEDLEVLLERFKQMACLLTGENDSEAECSYCHGTVSLGEALLTAHLSGVLAHIKCPEKALAKIMQKAKPDPAFDFDGFMKAVDERLKREFKDKCHGEIIISDKKG